MSDGRKLTLSPNLFTEQKLRVISQDMVCTYYQKSVKLILEVALLD